MKLLSVFICVFLLSGDVIAQDTQKTQININELPEREGNSTSDIQQWIDVLEKGDYLVNVPQDTIDYWRSPGFRSHVRSRTIIDNIEAYNTVDPKTLDELKEEFQLRERPLPDEYYEFLLELWRSHELAGGDYFLDEMEAYKKQLSFLDTLTDEQWAYVEEEGIDFFIHPSYGVFHELKDFIEFVGWYVPLMTVPIPDLDIARYFVFRVDENKWPVLAVIDNGKIMKDGRMLTPVDVYDVHAKLRWKYVVSDGTEYILNRAEFVDSFSNLEYALLHIPPQKGRLYWQFHDFALTANSDVKGDSEWVGGIEITACYKDSSEMKMPWKE